MEERKTVRIGCRIPNGLQLRLMKEGEDDGTGSGVRPMVIDGHPVKLAGASALHAGAGNAAAAGADAGVTDVDAEWWEKWRDQNKGANPLLDEGHIFECDTQ